MVPVPSRPDLRHAFGRYESTGWRLLAGKNQITLSACGWLLGVVIDASADERILNAHVRCWLVSSMRPAQLIGSGEKHPYRECAMDDRIIVLGCQALENKSSADPFTLYVKTDTAFDARVMQLHCWDLPEIGPSGQLARCNLRACPAQGPCQILTGRGLWVQSPSC